MDMMGTLRIGQLGFGVVGGGVVELLRHDTRIKFVKIAVRDPLKARDVELPPGTLLTTNPMDIANDSTINTVIDVMGGCDIARKVVMASLANGKHIISANKAMLSRDIQQIHDVIKSSKGSQGLYLEAAVCGGIPIMHTLRRALVCDEVHRLTGIMNGTSNYMLTRMAADKVEYSSILREAQEKGYAEADPSADVLGWDARSKLCLMVKLSMGVTCNEDLVFCQGIEKLTQDDFRYAKLINRTIKLLGVAERKKLSDGSWEVQLSVGPVLVPLSEPLSRIDDAMNVVEVKSKNLGKTTYVGVGAGRFPTANSVVADIFDLLSRFGADGRSDFNIPDPFPLNLDSISKITSDFDAEFFVRFVVVDAIGIIEKIAALFAKHKVSIFSVLQTPIADPNRVPFTIVTDSCRLSVVQTLCAEITDNLHSQFSFILDGPVFLRYMQP